MQQTTLSPQHKTGPQVRAMFDAICPRYDLLNRVLSVGLDAGWRRRAVRAALAAWTARAVGPERRTATRVLDVCCGTGDLALCFRRDARVGSVTGVDFVPRMVRRARGKEQADPGSRRGREGAGRWVIGDSLDLPFREGRFDVVSIAFGLRNLEDPERGLREMARVLAPGGVLAILEFFPPPPGWRSQLFNWYFHQVLPRVGRWLSGPAPIDAYRYLPESVKGFAAPETVAQWLGRAGLTVGSWKRLSFGAVALLIAEAPSGAATGCGGFAESGLGVSRNQTGLVRIA